MPLGTTTPEALLRTTSSLAVAAYPGSGNWFLYGIDESGMIWEATNSNVFGRSLPNCWRM